MKHDMEGAMTNEKEGETPDLREILHSLIGSGREIAPDLVRRWLGLQYYEGFVDLAKTVVVSAAVACTVLGAVHFITDSAYRLPANQNYDIQLRRMADEKEWREQEAKKPRQTSSAIAPTGTVLTLTSSSSGLVFTTSGYTVAR